MVFKIGLIIGSSSSSENFIFLKKHMYNIHEQKINANITKILTKDNKFIVLDSLLMLEPELILFTDSVLFIWIVGFNVGSNEGMNVGFKEGVNVGFKEGVKVGFKEGVKVGFNEAMNIGFNVGFNVGYKEGINVGFK